MLCGLQRGLTRSPTLYKTKQNVDPNPSHMRPDGSEDAKHDHEHATPVLRHERASLQLSLCTANVGEPLSNSSVVALTSVLARISEAVSNIDDCILTAAKLTADPPVQIGKYTEWKRELEVTAVVIVSYIDINMEHDTVSVVTHTQGMVECACRHCAHLCDLMEQDHP